MSGSGKRCDFECNTASEEEEYVHTAARRSFGCPSDQSPSPSHTRSRRRLGSRTRADTLPRGLYIPGVNTPHPVVASDVSRASLRFVGDSESRAEIELPVFDTSTLASAAVARASGETDPSLSWLFSLEETCPEAVSSYFEIRSALVVAHNLSFVSPSHLRQELAQAELLQGVEARHRNVLHRQVELQAQLCEQEQVVEALCQQLTLSRRRAAVLTLARGDCHTNEGGDLDLSKIEILKHQVELLVAENLRLSDINEDILDANEQLRVAFDTAGERLKQAREFQDQVLPLILRDLAERRRQVRGSRHSRPGAGALP